VKNCKFINVHKRKLCFSWCKELHT